MINIKEVAKTMTRKEFLEEAKEMMMGKLNDYDSCPKNHNLRQFSETECNPFVNCKECWIQAVKGIKFKDDLEVEKVKKLNIIEAMKMPIGTEFNIIVYGKDEGIVFLRKFDDKDKGSCLYWKDDEFEGVCESQIYTTDETINATFIPIQQPVSFMEVVNSDKKCKVEHELIKDKMSRFKTLSDVLEALSKYYGSPALREIILEGKWYIEESEADSNDIR